MVFDLILLAVAFVGSAVASVFDLKTTEVPDWIFYAMFGIGLPIVIVNSYISSSISPLIMSSAAGLGLLAFGYMMYKGGQWGGADAILLGIMGFLVPQIPSGLNANLLFPFPVSYLFNLFIIGTAYMIIYSACIAFKNDKFKTIFVKEMKASSKLLATFSILLFAIFLSATYYLQGFFSSSQNLVGAISSSIPPLFLTISIFFIYKFAMSVEKNIFTRRVSVSKLKIGDVLMKKREIIGIDRKELVKIRKSGEKYVWIKEGISFVPAFTLSLLFTIFAGDAILLMIPFGMV